MRELAILSILPPKRARGLPKALRASELEKAAQTALETLRALGYKDLQWDLAVRGLCVDCAAQTPASSGIASHKAAP